MRFYTMKWWCGYQAAEDDQPFAEYSAHLSTIRDLLPPDLLTIEDSVCLHDTRLRELRLTASEGALTMVLENPAGDERFTLTYGGVVRFDSVADPRFGLGGPWGYGDLGYYEVDILPGGAIEHRLLFSTGIELVVVFRSFRLERARCASR